MHVDRAWCWPGDTVRVTVTVDNESGRTLKASQLFLQQQAVMHASTMVHPDMQPSYSGTIFTVSHFVCIRFSMGWFMMPLILKARLVLAAFGPPAGLLPIQLLLLLLQLADAVSEMAAAVLQVPLRVLVGPLCATLPGPRSAKDGKDGAEVSFFAEPPAFWKPSVVVGPLALHVNAASPLPPEALVADASFWARATGGK
ncbi:hypothetical protein CHLNCDRAFT_137094 [Chlorella variabilis]|uniref:Uncharacterized protein n=1 Tax=Chlorella variabilis TaxID=554065 RepID=E1ZLZ7_CHLVA|nr:hypothetical protein CHLNCDRAFT_137094 [Chlorella variabilis]EFN53219.1 hypothetical protein CHLNCDRAFT_137094 [Chlorella variabilis]|eukprot:XP_005845321.1 hypothetical protein CHLNCDRAFT_137094 [Chlorella variabilis]